jgi:hypothetical protein
MRPRAAPDGHPGLRELGRQMTEEERRSAAAEHLRAAREALARGAWKAASAEFERSLAYQESPEALEGLGMAASRLNDPRTALEVREIGYFLYRDAGDWAGAARMATWLALGHGSISPDAPQVQTWLRRAHEALNGRGPVSEAGWLAVCEGKLALLHGDVPAARRFGAEAASIGRRLGLIELEREGLALVRSESSRPEAVPVSKRSGGSVSRLLLIVALLVVLLLLLTGALVLTRVGGGALLG